MKKKIAILIICFLLVIFGYKLYGYLRVKYAKVEVDLVEDLTLEFNDEKKVSDYISSINGKIIDDYVIDSTKIGKKEVSFKFINDDKIKLDYSFVVDVVDTVKPVVWLNDIYRIAVGSENSFIQNILCGDNYDSNPTCEIIGDYNLNEVGDYPVTFKATDSSGNVTDKDFVLKVYEPDGSGNVVSKTKTNFPDIVDVYKSDKTKIGIDVSHWQGDIDFEKIKNAGVEFIIIKAGGTNKKGERYLDSKFVSNIQNANKYGIDAGLYFFSYTSSVKQSKKDAKWLLRQIKNYDIDLPIAFDWEDWSNFNSYNLSFFGLTSVATGFLDTIEKSGYDGMIYGSKNYLEKIWLKTKYDIWLAHYVPQTDYAGSYKLWQICDDGIIDGIDGYVDIDIMYE
ncbi:MAG: hypothetical protein IJ093_01385 [Bacilli bacterium]|nr:hypothetical protein [Bacilli bacterium]